MCRWCGDEALKLGKQIGVSRGSEEVEVDGGGEHPWEQ